MSKISLLLNVVTEVGTFEKLFGLEEADVTT